MRWSPIISIKTFSFKQILPVVYLICFSGTKLKAFKKEASFFCCLKLLLVGGHLLSKNKDYV